MIEISNLTKFYVTPTGKKYIFKDVSVTLPFGKNIGLIGRNGAGKSTLVRLLSGSDVPDRGRIVSTKSISWPVGLAGGFQGSLSGRDNVKFVCRVYGAVGALMREKIEYVDKFSELGDWFDNPVKTYSSGMRSRLAFGLSMAFDFDYYLIDEVMSVGDAQFKKKCLEVLKEKLQSSSLILVTHSMSEIRKLCDLVFVIQDGKLNIFEDVEEGIKAYQS